MSPSLCVIVSFTSSLIMSLTTRGGHYLNTSEFNFLSSLPVQARASWRENLEKREERERSRVNLNRGESQPKPPCMSEELCKFCTGVHFSIAKTNLTIYRMCFNPGVHRCVRSVQWYILYRQKGGFGSNEKSLIVTDRNRAPSSALMPPRKSDRPTEVNRSYLNCSLPEIPPFSNRTRNVQLPLQQRFLTLPAVRSHPFNVRNGSRGNALNASTSPQIVSLRSDPADQTLV
ncbi:unnamed protein product [Nesidiocoris tenuis]|uniref:Uncharacterized protein n=1 Tax=Nesidiocoris tenuis TaxID=355587 RepID=A0A6H5GGE0_9HEMI|nr:unnamed protein product [Nesidiocoris tenuis]